MIEKGIIGERMSQEKTFEASLKGHFLIAMPSLADPNFSETVTYLCEHTDEGAVGLVINRVDPGLTIEALFRELQLESKPHVDTLPIHLGGLEQFKRPFRRTCPGGGP
jgi:putative transcriptional regulator